MISIIEAEDEISKHLAKNIDRLLPIMEDLITENSKIMNDEIKSNLLTLAGFKERTGKTRTEGFEYIQHHSTKKGVSVSGYFWARIANIFENYTDKSRRKYLTPIMKKIMSKDSQANQNFEKALKKLEKE